MPDFLPPRARDAAIRDRLRVLLATRTQADLARKAGTTPSAMGRYLRGAHVPAAVCASLARSLAVNPAWLLLGEGLPSIDDAAGDAARELLHAVEAMNVVDGARLGALAGRDRARILRELKRATEDRRSAAQRLRSAAAPLVAAVLAEFRAALDDRDLPRASMCRDLAQTAALLAEDDDAGLAHAELEARLETEAGNAEAALAARRRILWRLVAQPGATDAALVDAASCSAEALASSGRVDAALRTARALMALAPGAPRPALAAAGALIDFGRPRDAAALLHACIPDLHGEDRDVARVRLLSCHLLSGITSIAQAGSDGLRLPGKEEALLRHALLTEDHASLLAVLNNRQPPGDRHARLLVTAIEGRAEAAPDLSFLDEAAAAVVLAQMLRLSGSKEALDRAREADRILSERDPALLLPLPLRAAHHRNLRELGGTEAMRAASFRRAMEEGGVSPEVLDRHTPCRAAALCTGAP